MNRVFFNEIKQYIPKGKRLNRKIDLLVLGENTMLESKDKTFRVPESVKIWNLLFLGALVFIFLLFFIAKAFIYQVVEKDAYELLAQQNTVRELLLQPERGVIYDRNGKFIVRNKPAFSIDLATNLCSFGYRDFGYCRSIVNKIGEVINLDKERIFNELGAKNPNIILATGLTKEQLLPLETNISKFPGVIIVTAPQRNYLYKDAFSHLIGYVGIGGKEYPTIEGKMGIEESYDSKLAGNFGSKVIEVDSLGQPLKTLSEKDPYPGTNMTLHIDLDLQNKAYELLKKTVSEGKADAGAVVAQDPQTGGILAMVNFPAFDPDLMSSGISSEELAKLSNDPGFPFFDRAISAAYPPGSTFKMVVASAVLEEGVVNERDTINDPGYIAVGSYVFRNWKEGGHGEVDLRRALQVSNDTYFYTVGGGYGGVKGLGIQKLSEWGKKFGFGTKTGIDLSGEVSGYMPDGVSRDWYLGDTYITSIGQGDVLATPLQTNNITSYFANGGYLMKPQVVKSVDGVGEAEMEIFAQNLTSKHNYDVVREGMHMSVTPGGTGYPVFDFPLKHNGIKLAGKTGTSEYINTKGEESTHAWFTVFGPYEEGEYDATIALTVFLEGGGGGSDDAAPIARELLDLWFK
ncbi:penicillin-binding protein 2 [candidate division WWE3 bacterium RIFCSPLOWO2_01_FULL_41_9]|uniref:Penicillin-binding protein 2 n=1 Tax=candidate division WWE3 bacterium RIFCSPLOWO2_01_FULL_41_9 TaxID=1802626 RepID=A0A1F4VK08_UNCKA|nr:MAG: penicillin-binding protein 2 [candidate division WWE3 bacterium RIFCSPLOWO2_01_FULL_41_9]